MAKNIVIYTSDDAIQSQRIPFKQHIRREQRLNSQQSYFE
jgi:hypothetical protein